MKYQPLKQPWNHQARALAYLHGRKWFALQMAMRTGKTKVALDDFGQLETDGMVDDLLVIAPAGVYRTWIDAVEDHVDPSLKKRLKIYLWRSGKKNASKEQLLRKYFMQARNGPRLLLINIEALSAVDEAFCLAEDFLKQRRVYFVIDESTTIKNESIRTERALKLGPLAEYRRILTGLISPRSPLDVFFQFQFLEPGSLGHRTYTSFKARYAIEKKMCTLPTGVLQGRLASRVGTSVTINGVMTQVTTLDRNSVMNELDRRGIWYQKFNTIVGYKNEDELRDRIAPHSFRVKLEDCYDLPPKLYSVRDIEMTPEQKRIYKSLKEKATAELTEMEHVTALSVVARMIRLHQVLCGHTRDEMDKLHEIPEKRTAALIDLLREVEGKAVIWASYDYNVRFISAALEEEFGEGCVARFWGGNEGTREEEEKIFQTDEACRFMIGTPAAGGRGRRWSAADTVIYFSNTNNLEHRSQSEERTQGIGKTESVVYIDLIVPDTVDARIIQALRDKIDMAATISGDTWKEWLI